MTDRSPQNSVSRPRRADAQRNYERLVAIARAATEEHGERISLEDVAREAGVAIGTLYNHFPTRQDLLAATFIDETEELRSLALQLAEHDEPHEALRQWLRLQLDYSGRGRSLGATVMSWKHVEGSHMQLAFASMCAAGEQLLSCAQDAGEIRDDIDLIDVLRLVWGIELSATHASASPERVDAMFDIVIAGLRP
jgi:AcrR family transcriptional regulator